MSRARLTPVLAALLIGAALPACAADDVAALLKTADRYRTDAANLQVETEVQTFKADGSPDKERRYTVFVQSGHRSLVLMRSPAEAGQKVLMLGDDFWLLMPNSQRPLRITPLQKLLGDASTGDIATLSWSEDYTGTLAGEERCAPPAEKAGDKSADKAADKATVPCLHLSLQATRAGVSYRRIELWLGKTRHEPLRAELYVQSDKLAKEAQFIYDKPAGSPSLISTMVLTDRLGSGKQTFVHYRSRQPKAVPDHWLNPMFLARNPALE